MRANLFKKMAVYAALAALLPVAGSCVNKKYEMSEDRLDLNVTVFQDGLTLPLGSTVKVRLDFSFKQSRSSGRDEKKARFNFDVSLA